MTNMTTDRIPLFLQRVGEMCDEVGIPHFDDYKYASEEECLLILWSEPEFCLGIPLRTASLFSQTSAELYASWVGKFGGDWKHRLERRRARAQAR